MVGRTCIWKVRKEMVQQLRYSGPMLVNGVYIRVWLGMIRCMIRSAGIRRLGRGLELSGTLPHKVAVIIFIVLLSRHGRELSMAMWDKAAPQPSLVLCNLREETCRALTRPA